MMAAPGRPADDAPDADVLPRALSFWDAVAIVVGSIIGSGVFLKEGTIAREVGAFGPILLIWIVAGAVTLCGALSLAELAAMLPRAGGPYVYLREAYGRLPAFLWGWTEFWIIRTGSLGSLAVATALYLKELLPLSFVQQWATASALIVILAVINVLGVRAGAFVQNATTLLKVSFLSLLIAAPLFAAGASTENLSPWTPSDLGSTFWRSVGLAMIAVLWPYDGWINLGPVAEEVRDPQRIVPRALGLGVGIVIAVYVSVAVSYHLLLPFDRVAGAERVAADACRELFGARGAQLAALGVMFSTLGACNANILIGPRIYFAAARDGLLPAAVSRVHAAYRTPANAIWLQAGWALVLLTGVFVWKSGPNDRVLDAFDTLTNLVIFGGQSFYALAVAAVSVLRRRHPEWPRPYRAWGYPWTTCLYLGVFACVLASLLIDKPVESAVGSVLIAAGLVYYAWAVRRKSQSAT